MRDKLRVAREGKGLTQEQMAHLLGYRSKSHYCMIENGQRGVSAEIALRISEVLGKPVEELFNVEDVHGMTTGGNVRLQQTRDAPGTHK